MLDKKIIVTGGTYGMGASIVQALVASSATVASMARSTDLGERQAEELLAKGPGKIQFYPCDVSVRSQVRDAFAAAAADMSGVDALVHVAGVENGANPEDETDEEWDRIFNINAKGTFITNQEVFPYLRANGGRILNFGAGAGLAGMAVGATYSASKGAVAAWTRSVAQAWGQYDITVNCICPAVWTPMYDAHRARYTPEELREHEAAIARMVHIGGKLGDPDRDLAPVIVFLCSDEARYITGQTICIDGGALKVR
jgi:NAD(P)-dependent dehydrogenase (short-subunit alcohol dehydrogenase family)